MKIADIIKVPKKTKTTKRQSSTNSSQKNIEKVQKHQISLMDEDKKKLARSNFNKLKIDPSSAAFAEEILDKKLLLKLKKSNYVEDKKLFNLVNLLDKKNVIFEPERVKRTDYVEK